MKKYLILALFTLVLLSSTVQASAIIGNPVSNPTGQVPAGAGLTYINTMNPAVLSGCYNITNVNVSLWGWDALLTNVKIVTFYNGTGAGKFTARGSVSVGNANAQPITYNVTLNLCNGDYIGMYATTGSMGLISGSGGSEYQLAGDQSGASDVSFGSDNGYKLDLGANYSNNTTPFINPTVTLSSPTNTTTSVYQPLTYTVTGGTFNISSCWYILDGGANTSLPACGNLSSIVAATGFHTISVYTNDTNNTRVGASVSFSYNFNGLNIFAFDQANGTAVANFTATLSNFSQSTMGSANAYNITFLNYNPNNVLYTLTASAVNYGTAAYSFYSTGGQPTMNIYLLPNSAGHTVSIRTATASGSPITNSLVIIQRLINSSYVNVTVGYTDDTGIVSSFLDGTITYRLIIQFPSGQRIFSFQPASNLYVFTDFGISGTPGSIFNDISYSTTPTSNILTQNISQIITLTVNSYYGSLQGGLISAVWNGNTYLANLTKNAANTTGTASVTIDLSAATIYQTVTANFYVNSSNVQIGYLLLSTRTYTIGGNVVYQNLTLDTILKNFNKNSGIPIATTSLIALLFATLATGLIHSKTSMSGFTSLIIFVGMLGIFTVAGWFDPLMFFLVLIISGLYYFYAMGGT